MQYETFFLPAFKDNYIVLIASIQSRDCLVVDPGDADLTIDFCQKENLKLKYILNTHHHSDHIGGNLILKQKYGAHIIAPKLNQAQITADQYVEGGENLDLIGLKISVIHSPGHTLGHVLYYLPKLKTLFVGDTLFSLGCGRLFEGDAQTMWQSLKYIRDSFADETQIICSHEYTLQNLRFAEDLLPHDVDLAKFRKIAEQRLQSEGKTIPTSLGVEKKLNPFLKADQPEYLKKIGIQAPSSVEAFAQIRQLRNNFT